MKIITRFKGKFKGFDICTKKMCLMVQFYPWFSITKIYNPNYN